MLVFILCLDPPPILFFLFYLFIYFTILYWFCHTLTWIRHRCPCVPHPETPPPPSPSHPSGSSQCTSPEHPISCIEPGLVIHFTYDNLFFPALLPISPFVPMSACTTLAPRPCFPWAALRQWLSAGRKPTKALRFEMRTSFNGWLWLKDSPLAWPELSYNCACTPGSSFCLCFTGLGLHQPKEKIGPSILR